MDTRLIIENIEPEAYRIMFEMEEYLAGTSLNPLIKEIIRLRVSQINGCAYCIELHFKSALEKGLSKEKLFALTAWKESPRFSDIERLVLKFTEEVTLISDIGVSEETFQGVKRSFTENEIAQMIMLIGTVNLWNRMAISTRLTHEG